MKKRRLLILGVVSPKFAGTYINGVGIVVENLFKEFSNYFEVSLYGTNMNEKKLNIVRKEKKIFGFSYFETFTLLMIYLLIHPIKVISSIFIYKNVYGHKPFRMLAYELKIMKVLKIVRPDIIHCHGSQFAIILKRRNVNIPFITTYHDIPYLNSEAIESNKKRGIDIKKFYIKSAKLVNFFTCLNETKYNDLLTIDSSKTDSRKYRIIGNGIDLDKFDINHIQFKNNLLNQKKKVFITVASLTKRKGHHRFIKYIYDNKLYIDYWIIGDGPEKENLVNLAKQYDLENKIKFYGNISNDELYNYYSAADSFILPSTSEGQAMCILEAMACGLDIYIDKNIIDTVKFNEPSSRFIHPIDFMQKSTENILEVNNYERRIAIRASMSEYSWENIAIKYINFFNEVLTYENKKTRQ